MTEAYIASGIFALVGIIYQFSNGNWKDVIPLFGMFILMPAVAEHGTEIFTAAPPMIVIATMLAYGVAFYKKLRAI